MICVYTPRKSAGVFRYHLGQIPDIQYDLCHGISDFANHPADVHIACLQIPYPWCPEFDDQIWAIYELSDHIIIQGNELHAQTAEFCRRWDRPKITYFLCGELQPTLTHARTERFLDWFVSTLDFYRHRPDVLDVLRPYDVKPLYYDALLGRKKPHRDQAWIYLAKHQLMNSGIVTYVNDHKINFDLATKSQWIWETTGVLDLESRQSEMSYTVESVHYYDRRVRISQILPLDIYNQTAYSLVAETGFDNDFVFFTEKTVKPMLAQRLFIMLGHQHHLRALRNLGFKTFGGIINEHYDDIHNITDRHQAALEQLHWLCQQPQEQILSACEHITRHNHELLVSTDWYGDFQDKFSPYFRSAN
jgi:hypothetical protein